MNKWALSPLLRIKAPQSLSFSADPKWVEKPNIQEFFFIFILFFLRSHLIINRRTKKGRKAEKTDNIKKSHGKERNGRQKRSREIQGDREGERRRVQLVAERERCKDMTPPVPAPDFTGTYMTAPVTLVYSPPLHQNMYGRTERTAGGRRMGKLKKKDRKAKTLAPLTHHEAQCSVFLLSLFNEIKLPLLKVFN